MASKGIIYEYEDGGRYCGEWENDAAHGHGVCTGPDGNGLFQGLWERGNQSIGVFSWPSGQKYMGKWQQGVREGVGKETKKDGTEYCGEFTRDSRGPYGVLRQPNGVVYRGTWREGVQSGLGTEIYIDGGVYRGEYQNGTRHGHGTRSSSNYERSNAAETVSIHSSQDDSLEALASILEDPSSIANTVAGGPTSLDTTNAQIYEGEWKADQRHGYGVLRIVNHYSYYGQWEDNMRSGYGVMICEEEKRKEEGEWHRGKLVQKLKRKKLQLKWKQLETKVNQAHMSALQAAEAARSNANLAEGRANTANARSRLAMRAAQQALKESESARAVENFYRNAPKVQENAKSPVTGTSNAGRGSLSSGTSGGSVGGTLLQLPQTGIPETQSFEDLAAMDRGLRSNDGGASSESSESLEEAAPGEVLVGGVSMTEKERKPKWPHVSPVPWRKKIHERSMLAVDETKERREKFHKGRHSSADLLLRSRDDKEEDDEDEMNDFILRDGDSLQKRRKILLNLHQTSESDPVFTTSNPGRRRVTEHEQSMNSLSSDSLLQQPQQSLSQRLRLDERVTPESKGALRHRHIYKATGEPDNGEVTDDEDLSKAVSSLSPLSSASSASSAGVKQTKRPQSVSVEVLAEMARWNKMVAYLNLALLFFLLFLIVVVVVCMNYFWLIYQMPVSVGGGAGGGGVGGGGGGTMDLGSSHYATGPLA